MEKVQTLSDALVDEVLERARKSERKRAMHCFSGHHEPLQRMVNAGLKGTYIQPHKHESPDKFELLSVLRGRIAVFTFDNDGEVATCTVLDANGPLQAVEIPARTWHSMVLLTDEAACHEIILGSYQASTHKQFAPWAPSESEPERAAAFLAKLEALTSEMA